MENHILAIGLAIVVFACTNIDDILVLVAFFANPAIRVPHVVIGQYLGIGTLYAASVTCSLVSIVLPSAYVGLLGLAPVAIGAVKLWGLRRRGADDRDDAVGRPLGSGQILAVCAVTVANGGDNIGVYTPVFALGAAQEVALFGVVFAVMTALWCLAAYWMVNHRKVGAPIRRHAQRIVPFVLISLGLLILHDAGTFDLLDG